MVGGRNDSNLKDPSGSRPISALATSGFDPASCPLPTKFLVALS